jgi:hypothetical protein
MSEHCRETFRKLSTCENFRKFSITSENARSEITRGTVVIQYSIKYQLCIIRWNPSARDVIAAASIRVGCSLFTRLHVNIWRGSSVCAAIHQLLCHAF